MCGMVPVTMMKIINNGNGQHHQGGVQGAREGFGCHHSLFPGGNFFLTRKYEYLDWKILFFSTRKYEYFDI